MYKYTKKEKRKKKRKLILKKKHVFFKVFKYFGYCSVSDASAIPKVRKQFDLCLRTTL